MEITEISGPRGHLITAGRKHRLTLYSESLVRLEYSADGAFPDEDPLILEPSFGRCQVPYKLSESGGAMFLETGYFRLRFGGGDGPFDIGNLEVFIPDAPSGGYAFEPGKPDGGNIGGAYLDLYKYPSGKIYENFTEGLVSRNGYFLYRNHCEFHKDPPSGWIKKRETSDFQDWYLFAYGSDVKRAFADYTDLFGKVPLVPKYALGYWYSRWHKFSAGEILAVIDRLKELGIPPDVFVIDTDWRKHGWNGYEWNRKYFSAPSDFLGELKKRGIACCLNDHPGYGVSDDLPADDPYREKIRAAFPEVESYRVYWNDPRYVNAWKKEIFTKMLDEGVDFWWVDGWGASGGIMDIHSQMWLNRFYYEAAAETADGRRPMILSRWGGVGSHKYPVQFSGDTYSTFETIKRQISFTHQGSNLGAAWWSHDIGGFLGGKINEEMFVRWVEFGCFSPIFRTHSSGASRDVWNYSDRAVGIFRKYVKVRRAMKPYLYSLARECSTNGVPPFRGLYVEYPRDLKTYDYAEEYLIGPRLLAAPAYGPGEIFEREVYFPVGRWIPLETDGGVVTGPTVLPTRAPLDTMPLFAAEGAIVPSSSDGGAEHIEFLILPSETPSDFLYYEDDGKTPDPRDPHRRSERRVNVARMSSGRVEITLFPAEGVYPGMPEKQKISFVIYAEGKKPTTVKINGADASVYTRETNAVFSNTLETPQRFVAIDAGETARNQKISVELTF